MNGDREWGFGKGDDENLREYKIKTEQKKLIRKLIIPIVVVFFVTVLTVMIIAFGFDVRTVTVAGETKYSHEDLIERSGIQLKDNIIFLSEKAVADALKESFPYIKEVEVEKKYPSDVIIHITEEYTTYYYEAEGEYFLFDYNLRLMDKFDSLEALKNVREAIMVDIPLPKSSIVTQGIRFDDEYSYISEFVHSLSESSLVDFVTYIDLRDCFVLRLHCGKDVRVELGDYHNLEAKFSALLGLLGENGKKMTGTVDISCYPRCFYDLREEYDS